MEQVFNWQLGRKMDYLYPEVRPKKQFTMIIDPNKCIACQTCTVNCKQTWTWGKGQEYMLWNNVETKPYGFWPTGWDVRVLEKLGTGGWEGGVYKGKTIFEAAPAGERVAGWLPDREHWAYPNLGEDEPVGAVEQGTYIPNGPHDRWMFYLPRICNHCTYPACLSACSRNSIYKRPEDGIVLTDQSRCRGYRECVRACPYKKVMFNNSTGVSEKCIGCYPALENGFQNQCVTACIGRIRLSGWNYGPETVDEHSPIDFLVKVRKIALPLYPQFGTEPNVFYMPPIHVPEPYLIQMFGAGAPAAIKTYRNIPNDETLLGLLMLFGTTDRIIHRFKVENGKAYGYDEKGVELVSVPVREPSYIRPFYDGKLDVYRHNIT